MEPFSIPEKHTTWSYIDHLVASATWRNFFPFEVSVPAYEIQTLLKLSFWKLRLSLTMSGTYAALSSLGKFSRWCPNWEKFLILNVSDSETEFWEALSWCGWNNLQFHDTNPSDLCYNERWAPVERFRGQNLQYAIDSAVEFYIWGSCISFRVGNVLIFFARENRIVKYFWKEKIKGICEPEMKLDWKRLCSHKALHCKLKSFTIK